MNRRGRRAEPALLAHDSAWDLLFLISTDWQIPPRHRIDGPNLDGRDGFDQREATESEKACLDLIKTGKESNE